MVENALGPKGPWELETSHECRSQNDRHGLDQELVNDIGIGGGLEACTHHTDLYGSRTRKLHRARTGRSVWHRLRSPAVIVHPATFIKVTEFRVIREFLHALGDSMEMLV